MLTAILPFILVFLSFIPSGSSLEKLALKDGPYDKDWATLLTVISILFLSSLIKKFSANLIGARETLGQELAINPKLGRNLI